jgi:uncharacterized membrane protein YbhN (UPF0104 family)
MSTSSPAPAQASGPVASIRRWLPFVGAAVLIGWVARSTDLDAVAAAMQQADLVRFFAIVAVSTLVIWLHDAACLVWLVRATLGHRGRQVPVGMGDMAPVKATSYVLNILNYHAASMAMAWLVGRRKGVTFLESAGAMATLTWLDLLTVAAMAVVGLFLAPGFFADYPGLDVWLQAVAAVVLTAGLVSVVLLQSKFNHPLLVRLRDLPPLRPLASLTPLHMLQGLALRCVLMSLYTVSHWASMQTFGLQPSIGHLILALPILTIVGTIPISVSGYGSTQVLMRHLYVPFLVGSQTTAVIDAWSTSMITTFVVMRLMVAAPYLPAISRELREKPADLA